jgi:Uncharacterized conserved protein
MFQYIVLDLRVGCPILKFGHIHIFQRELNPNLFRVDLALGKQDNRLDVTYLTKTNFFFAIRNKFSNNFLFDLPTEAQWEFACRAETTTAWNNGKDITNVEEDQELSKLAWYFYTDGNLTHKGGTKTGNAWGLYDMHGNVWEWCLDWHASFDSTSVTDPKGAATGTTRVLKSGSYHKFAQYCRSAERDGEHAPTYAGDDNFGFRVAIHPPAKTYMVVDLSGGTSAASYPVSYLSGVPEGGWGDEYKTTKLVLRLVEPGTFTMGSPSGEIGRDTSATGELQHQVTLTKPYYIGIFEMTQGQYKCITGNNPADRVIALDHPVNEVSYDMIRGTNQGQNWPADNNVDSDSFIGVLRNKTGLVFDLPTEAQWEYACRAETTTALNSGKDLTKATVCPNMAEVGRYTHNTTDGKGNYFVAPGQYLVNNWGIYDMHGNLAELCLDYYAGYSADSQTDPKGPSTGTLRVQRGGDWEDIASECRSARRVGIDSNYHHQTFGFRVVVEQ